MAWYMHYYTVPTLTIQTGITALMTAYNVSQTCGSNYHICTKYTQKTTQSLHFQDIDTSLLRRFAAFRGCAFSGVGISSPVVNSGVGTPATADCFMAAPPLALAIA